MSQEVDDSGLTSVLQRLSLSEKSAISIKKVEEDYVLDVAIQKGSDSDRYVAATSSDYSVRLLRQGSLASVGSLTGHTDVISGITFSSTDSNTLFSSSHDKCVKCWDLRTSKCEQIFEGPGNIDCVYGSLDVNSNDFILCAGTEQAKKDGGVHILFWDRRKKEFLGSYNESHQDDITQVCFHPTDPNKLATGSTDGLVCMYNIAEEDEDDAISFTFNSDSSVSKIGWCGTKETDLYCVTHIDTLHIWDTEEGDDILEIKDAKETLKGPSAMDYMVDCFMCKDKLHFIGGSHSGDLNVYVASKDMALVTSLRGGHTKTVRCSLWDESAKSLITGGEDSLLCLWATTTSSKATGNQNKSNLKMKKSVSKKSRPY